MTTTPPVHPAEERLLDVGLATILAEPETGALRPQSTHPPREEAAPGRPSSPRLAAALVVLGLTAVAATLWQVRSDHRSATPQDPAPTRPLPPETRAENRSEIDALPVITRNLAAWITRPDGLEALTRLTHLERLILVAADMKFAGMRLRRQKHPQWQNAPDRVLEPLSDLPALRTLRLPSSMKLRPAHLAALRDCPKLREVELVGEQVTLSPGFLDALAALPQLDTLRLDIVTIDTATITRLAELELRELVIGRCPGLDAEGFAAICALPTLESLGFRDLGRRQFGANDGRLLWKPEPADLHRLGDLPNLTRLDFFSCDLGEDELRALPTRITSLRLRGHELPPAALRHLDRFGQLRELEIATGRFRRSLFDRTPPAERQERRAAVASAIGKLRLTDLDYSGSIGPDLLTAIARQPDLTRLRLYSNSFEDLEPLATAPRLRHLELLENGGDWLDAYALRPIAKLPALESLLVYTMKSLDRTKVAPLFEREIDLTLRAFVDPK
ncbi:MAG: hypothetical protein NXI31_14420 [bacterium]|nr:hypothetical protein [bacterium]